jgi:hypothetical protein
MNHAKTARRRIPRTSNVLTAFALLTIASSPGCSADGATQDGAVSDHREELRARGHQGVHHRHRHDGPQCRDDLVRICHFPPGTQSPRIIEVSERALASHLAHGDGLAPESVQSNADCLVPQPPADPVSATASTGVDGIATFVIPATNIRVVAAVTDEQGSPLAGMQLTLIAAETGYLVVAQDPADVPTYAPAFAEGSLLDARPGSAPTLAASIVMQGFTATFPGLGILQSGGTIPGFVASQFYASEDRCLSREEFRAIYQWQCEVVLAATGIAASAAGIPASEGAAAVAALFSLAVSEATTVVNFACSVPGPLCELVVEASTAIGLQGSTAAFGVAPSPSGFQLLVANYAASLGAFGCSAAADEAAEQVFGATSFMSMRQYTTPLLGPGVSGVPLYFQSLGPCGGACCDSSSPDPCTDVRSGNQCATEPDGGYHEGDFCSSDPCAPPEADLVLLADPWPPSTSDVGQRVDLLAYVENQGPDDADDVVVQFQLVGPVTDVEAEFFLNGAADPSDAVGCAVTGSQIVCDIGLLDSGEFANIEGTVVGAEPGSATAQVAASSAATDPDPANNSDTAGWIFSACSWSGTWETDFGTMQLLQVGSSVTGTYTFRDGSLSGELAGTTLSGTWAEVDPSDASCLSGDLEFTMLEDCSSFVGSYWCGPRSSGGASGPWNGSAQ